MGFLLLFYVHLLVASLHSSKQYVFIIVASNIIINLTLKVLCINEYIYNIGSITVSIVSFVLSPRVSEITLHCVFQWCTHPYYLSRLIPPLFPQSSHLLGSTSGMTLR